MLELSFWAEKNGPEIAAILDIPIGTVASRLRLARRDLNKKLAELADTQEALRDTTMTVAEWRQRIKNDIGHDDDDDDDPAGR